MSDRYDADRDDVPYSWLDEFLCEYVDGTMDPGTRAAFEEYLRANPALREHVQCLCRTRQLLCRYGACQAPPGFQNRLRQRLARETMAPQPLLLPDVVARLGTYATWASVMLLVFTVGMLAGTTFQATPGDGRSPLASAASQRTASEHTDPPNWPQPARLELALSGPARPLPTYLRPDRPAQPLLHRQDTLQAHRQPLSP